MTRLAPALYLATFAMLAAMTASAASTEVYYPPEVVAQVRALTTRADALGFHIGSSPNPSMCYHYQGMARSTGPGTPYFFITKSGNEPGVPCVITCSDGLCEQDGSGPGSLQIVRMGSRAADGERLRSNRIVRGRETSDSVPPQADVVVKTLIFDGAGAWPNWPNYGHLGGVQMIGDVLAVALEHPYEQADIDAKRNLILFIDVTNPEDPKPLSKFEFTSNDSTTAGTVAVTAQPNGIYLMLVAGKANRAVRIFESNGESLDSPTLAWSHKYTWRPSDNPVNPPCWSIPPSSAYPFGASWGWPSGGFFDYAHQTLNFVREGGPNGPLFLIGTRNDHGLPGPVGDDMIDVYRVSWDGSTFSLGCATQKHVETFASSDGSLLFGNKLADFAAGGGTYVSPTGELIVYGSEHDNDGPGGTVKMAEFRPRDVTRYGSPTLDPTVTIAGPYAVPEGGNVMVSATASGPRTKAWVQLWADDDWSSDDRYLVIDYPDRALDDFDNFNRLDDANFNPLADGFSDQASSLRWFAPKGCSIWLYDDDFGSSGFPGDQKLQLIGAGEPKWIADLDGNGDVFTSMKFDESCDEYYGPRGRVVGWDLNGDGSYETAGSSFSFSAAALDGPLAAPLRARVTQVSDDRAGFAESHVTVVNVAPVVSPLTLRDGAGRVIAPGGFVIVGLPVALSATFTDPGRADTHAPSVSWGDGSLSGIADLDAFAAATGGAVGSVLDRHRFVVAGSFAVTLTVVDDDGGSTSSSFVLRVLSARDAIQIVIDALPAGSKARDHLEGRNNGALAHLENGQLSAAMTKIVLALGLITDETLRGTLTMAAQAIAVESYGRALAANPSPNGGTANKLSDILARLDTGAAYVAASNWTAAVDAFADAVRRAMGMS